ncbi:hypothetical protein ES703_78899 [subsurface metagenome]|jgi:hypothetical protein
MVMPRMEMKVMTEIKACFLFAVRYRLAMNDSKFMVKTQIIPFWGEEEEKG